MISVNGKRTNTFHKNTHEIFTSVYITKSVILVIIFPELFEKFALKLKNLFDCLFASF